MPVPFGWGELRNPRLALPLLIGGTAFAVLFWKPVTTLLADWWVDPEAAHGLLLGPLALVLAWRNGITPTAAPARFWGMLFLAGAILLRYLSGLAAELFTMRLSLFMALGSLVVYRWGFRQLVHWWLPASLLVLSVPIPAVVLGSAALPLQLQASKIGAALLEWRHVPVLLAGNVIHLPGRSLFVTEACSGLRSLTALIALGLLVGGIWLRTPLARTVLLLLALPVAVTLNGVRVFVTGFLVQFVDPALGDGFMHFTEGWVIFVVAFAILGVFAWTLGRAEQWRQRRTA